MLPLFQFKLKRVVRSHAGRYAHPFRVDLKMTLGATITMYLLKRKVEINVNGQKKSDFFFIKQSNDIYLHWLKSIKPFFRFDTMKCNLLCWINKIFEHIEREKLTITFGWSNYAKARFTNTTVPVDTDHSHLKR